MLPLFWLDFLTWCNWIVKWQIVLKTKKIIYGQLHAMSINHSNLQWVQYISKKKFPKGIQKSHLCVHCQCKVCSCSNEMMSTMLNSFHWRQNDKIWKEKKNYCWKFIVTVWESGSIKLYLSVCLSLLYGLYLCVWVRFWWNLMEMLELRSDWMYQNT